MGCFIGVIAVVAAVAIGAVGVLCLKGGCKKDEKNEEAPKDK
jgi:hypothetical protein